MSDVMSDIKKVDIPTKDYEYVFNDKYPNTLALYLHDLEYSGIIVLYEDFWFEFESENDVENDVPTLSFKYKLAVNPTGINVPLKYLGDLLMTVITEQTSGKHDTNTVGT